MECGEPSEPRQSHSLLQIVDISATKYYFEENKLGISHH